MKGFVKIILLYSGRPYIRYIDEYKCIVKFESFAEFIELLYPALTIDEFKSPNNSYDDFVILHRRAGLCSDKCKNPTTCEFANKFNKGYMFRRDDGTFNLIHPDDFEKVERIVNCTLDPIYELIQELRYHPVIGIDANIARKRHKGVIGE